MGKPVADIVRLAKGIAMLLRLSGDEGRGCDRAGLSRALRGVRGRRARDRGEFRGGARCGSGWLRASPEGVEPVRGGSLEAWIWRIVINRALDARRRAPSVPLDFELVAVDERADGVLTAAVLGLPERRRTMVLLRYVAGLKNTEIAVALGVSEGTVAATLSQAREALAAVMRAEVES